MSPKKKSKRTPNENRIGAAGCSSSHLATSCRAVVVFDEFLVKDKVVGLRKLGQWPLSEEVVIEQTLWEYYAHYLVHVYKCSKGSKSDGDRATASTILTYFSAPTPTRTRWTPT